MCECNCARAECDYWLPGPDGTIYGIQIDPGCHNCQRPSPLAGVRIFLINEMDGDPCHPCFYDGAREVTFSPDEWGRFLPVVSADKLLEAAAEGAPDDPAEYGSAENFLHDCLLGRALSDAVVRTHQSRSAPAQQQEPTP